MLLNPIVVYGVVMAMLAVGGGFLYLVWKNVPGTKSVGVVEWVGTVMSLLLLLCAGVLGLVTYLQSPSTEEASAASVEAGNEVEDFSFRLVESDERKTLASYRGRVVLLNFWATWCPPCVEEMADLSRLQRDYARDGLIVLTVSDETRSQIQEYARETSLETVNGYVQEPRELPPTFQLMRAGRPITYIIDREGMLRHIVRGARDYTFFEEAIRPYL